MKTREQVNYLKRQIWWKLQRKEEVSPDVDGFEEYRGELAHFIECEMQGGFGVDTHNLAAEYGILDNMQLATLLRKIVDRLDAIQYPD